MKVSDLIEILKGHKQDLDVCYKCCSEYAMLEADDLEVKALCKQRPDGWVPDKRPDKPLAGYIVFPGN